MYRCIILCVLVLLMLEGIYRWQWIDFYKAEWKYQNQDVHTGNHGILVLGDSYSADQNSWVHVLKSADSTRSVWNAAIPGIGTETHRLLVKSRLQRTHPQIVILQLYVGNDLYDICKPINWSSLHFLRNCYWSLSNHFRFLGFANYRLGLQKADVQVHPNFKSETDFSINTYDTRTKIYIQADPFFPQNMIDLNENTGKLFDRLLTHIQEIKKNLDDSTQLKILIIPHCTQIHPRYVSNYKLLGAAVKWPNGNSWVKKFSELGYSVLDPTYFFSSLESLNTPVYFQNDIHLNAFGQQKLGEWVYQQIINK